MRGGIVIILVCLTALGAYSLGRQDVPAGKYSAAVVIAPPSDLSKPVALAAAQVDAPASPPMAKSPSPANRPAEPIKPAQPEVKHKADVVLTAAAIAAIIIRASRDQYHATGRPCACPDDLMRNGRTCGGRSAYTRPGGAAPLCYPTDVSEAMIEAYRKRLAAR
jgi:hypothetical protein